MKVISNFNMLILLVLSLNFNFITNKLDISSDDLFKYIKLYQSERFKTEYNIPFAEYYPKFFKCEDVSYNCAGNGICNETRDDCICTSGYTSFPNSFIKCTYPQKSSIVAILLEVFIPFGFGHLYIMNYGFFLAKFLMYFFTYYYVFCVMIFIGSINNSNVEEETYNQTKKICYVTLPIIFIWYLFDIIWFCLGNYQDGNNMDLY